MPKTTAENATLNPTTRRLCDDVLAKRGGLKAAVLALGKDLATIRNMDARKAAFAAAFAYIAEKGEGEGYGAGTWTVYRSQARKAANIPAANAGNRTKATGRKGGKVKAENGPEGEPAEPDQTTPKSTLNAWASLIPALKRHNFKLPELVKALEAAFNAA